MSDLGETNANPTPECLQSSLVVVMRDLMKGADDTVWLNQYETVFERLTTLYFIAGGKRETLAEIWPELF